jgi:hypothetical protein
MQGGKVLGHLPRAIAVPAKKTPRMGDVAIVVLSDLVDSTALLARLGDDRIERLQKEAPGHNGVIGMEASDLRPSREGDPRDPGVAYLLLPPGQRGAGGSFGSPSQDKPASA